MPLAYIEKIFASISPEIVVWCLLMSFYLEGIAISISPGCVKYPDTSRVLQQHTGKAHHRIHSSGFGFGIHRDDDSRQAKESDAKISIFFILITYTMTYIYSVIYINNYFSKIFN